MTNLQKIAHQCAFTTAALATMGEDPVWDARLTEYLRLQALQDAECDFGALARASEANKLEHIRAESIHGPEWRSIPLARAAVALSAAVERAADDAWTEQYVQPYWQAARDLAMTPAVSIAIALFKVQVIRWDELDNDNKMPRDPMQIVAEDMAGLARGR